jgi:hypothetical protein
VARAAKLPAAIDARHPKNLIPERVGELKMGQRALVWKSKLERDMFGRLFFPKDAEINSLLADDQETFRLYGMLYVIQRVRGGVVIVVPDNPIAPFGRNPLRALFTLGRAYLPVVKIESIRGT